MRQLSRLRPGRAIDHYAWRLAAGVDSVAHVDCFDNVVPGGELRRIAHLSAAERQRRTKLLVPALTQSTTLPVAVLGVKLTRKFAVWGTPTAVPK